MTKIEEIEGIGPAYAAKLESAGVKSVEALLTTGGTPKGRKDLAGKSGIDETLILKWVNRADLARIKGVGSECADILEAAGVDTVVELAKRNAQSLVDKMTEVNAVKHLVRKLPSLSQVEDWVKQAKDLPRAVTY
jgi:predicted flap endonuclease-1-like 5' DNA nuclease